MENRTRRRILTNLECENGHPLGAWEIWQYEFRMPDGSFLFRRTPNGALDHIRCQECGKPPKDPNP